MVYVTARFLGRSSVLSASSLLPRHLFVLSVFTTSYLLLSASNSGPHECLNNTNFATNCLHSLLYIICFHYRHFLFRFSSFSQRLSPPRTRNATTSRAQNSARHSSLANLLPAPNTAAAVTLLIYASTVDYAWQQPTSS
jgi:hypothetical protein